MQKIIKFKTVDDGPWRHSNICIYEGYIPSDFKLVYDEYPDFLFYTCYGTEFKKYENCIRIFYTGENIRPDFNECDYAIGFDRMDFGERYIRRPIHATKPKFDEAIDYTKRKFCNFIYSHTATWGGPAKREQFFDALSKYKTVDAPGKCKNNMRGVISPREGNFTPGKLQFIKNYKFTIAFENSFHPGYITEKLIHPFQANSIPIYMGDPDVALDFNPAAFVNCVDFKNWDDLIEYIEYLDTDDAAYMEMLKQPAMRADYKSPDIGAFLANIFNNGKQYRKNSFAFIYSQPQGRYNAFIKYLYDNLYKDNHADSANNHTDFNKFLYVNNFNADKIYTDELLPFLKKIKIDSSMPNVASTYAAAFISPGARGTQIESMLKSAAARIGNPANKSRAVKWINDSALEQRYRQLLRMLWPQDAKGWEKVRVGGGADGGYVMLDQGHDGVAISLGIGYSAPWDMQMAQNGWNIWQFDGTVYKSPNSHRNIRFFAKNVVASREHGANEITLSEILAMTGDERDIVLQMDIEGAEWPLLEAATTEELSRFKQIIAEFHGLTDPKNLESRIGIFEKICKSHAPVHFHYNNNGQVIGFSDFLVSGLFEISFLRRDRESFTPSQDCYPTSLDRPNVTRMPDVHIGRFADITKSA